MTALLDKKNESINLSGHMVGCRCLEVSVTKRGSSGTLLITCDRIWENPPYGMQLAQFSIVTKVENYKTSVFVVPGTYGG